MGGKRKEGGLGAKVSRVRGTEGERRWTDRKVFERDEPLEDVGDEACPEGEERGERDGVVRLRGKDASEKARQSASLMTVDIERVLLATKEAHASRLTSNLPTSTPIPISFTASCPPSPPLPSVQLLPALPFSPSNSPKRARTTSARSPGTPLSLSAGRRRAVGTESGGFSSE